MANETQKNLPNPKFRLGQTVVFTHDEFIPKDPHLRILPEWKQIVTIEHVFWSNEHGWWYSGLGWHALERHLSSIGSSDDSR